MSLCDGASSSAGTDPQFEHATHILQSALDRMLRYATLGESTCGSVARAVHRYAEQSESPVGTTVPRDDLAALQWLLAALEGQDQPELQRAVHSAIQLLSYEQSFRGAVEHSARRQMYNLAYGLTHEINNPLANIVARAQSLLSDVVDPRARKSLATIMDQAMRAHEMLAEVMRAVQPSTLPLQSTDIPEVVQQAWSSLRGRAEASGVRWEFRASSEPLFALAHAPSLLGALQLIGSNSLDVCGPSDSAIWSVESVGAGDEAMLRIALSDTGPGLSPEAQRSATDLFYSGREHGRGLGISLAVVRRIVELHRGDFAMHSEAGAGCRTEIGLTRIDAPLEGRPRVKL